MSHKVPRKPSKPLFFAALLALVACSLTVTATSWALPANGNSTLGLLVAGAAPLGAGAGDTLGARMLERAATRLELTDMQREEIRALVAGHGPRLVQAVRQVKQHRVELFQSIHEHPPVESEIRDASARLAEAQTELALFRAALVDDVHNVLTPEQQDELDQMKQNLRALLEMVADGFTDRLVAWLSA